VPWRRKTPDRNELVAAADRARVHGRTRRAIAGYRKALQLAPGDPAVHARIAPLLARAGRREEALASFRAAAEAQLRAGFVDRGLSLLVQAADVFPEEVGLWEEIARLHLARSRRADAFAALLDGGRRLDRLREFALGCLVLRRALEIEPWQPEATRLLARALAKGRRRVEALEILDGLDARARGTARRRARWMAFRISPTPRRLWRSIQASRGGR
jgi:tetratricopeptide (TPR) repeat protein